MKSIKSLLCSALAVAACFFLFASCENTVSDPHTTENTESSDSFSVVSSFYPMHILAMNLTRGIDNVTEESMSQPNIGCIHDHTFTTDDLKKVDGADVYIENGLGLEAFNDKIKEAYPDTVIIEASANIKGNDLNPHVWTNIDNYISQIKYTSEQLQTLDPDNKDKFAANETAYIQRLEKLKSDYSVKLAAVEGKKVLVLDESLPNLAEYAKLDMIQIETDHEEEALSADDLKQAIKTMNEQGIKSIFIGKGAHRAIAQTIAAETGATIYELNTCTTGTSDATADSYINEMKENFDTIITIE